MPESDPEKQVEATEYDQKGNAKLPPPPPEAAKKKRITVAELNKELDNILNVELPETLNWIGELDTRLETLEKEEEPRTRQALAYLQTQQDTTNETLNVLMDLVRSHIKEAATPQPEPEHEIEFTQPQQQRAGGTVDISGMIQWPNSCQTMNDVLLVCRALKESPEIPDKDKTHIIDIACKAARVIITQGLQIRAGVKFTGE